MEDHDKRMLSRKVRRVGDSAYQSYLHGADDDDMNAVAHLAVCHAFHELADDLIRELGPERRD